MPKRLPTFTTKGRFLPLVTRPGGLGYEKGVLLPPSLDPPVKSTLHIVIDGAGSVITTGVAGEATIKFPCKIVGWSLLADQAGSIIIDIWKTDLASYPPTVANTITGSTEPSLSSQASNSATTLSDWTVNVSAGDTFRFHVDSVSTVTRVALALALHKQPEPTF